MVAYWVLLIGIGTILVGLGSILGVPTGRACLYGGTLLAAIASILLLTGLVAHGT